LNSRPAAPDGLYAGHALLIVTGRQFAFAASAFISPKKIPAKNPHFPFISRSRESFSFILSRYYKPGTDPASAALPIPTSTCHSEAADVTPAHLALTHGAPAVSIFEFIQQQQGKSPLRLA
jgi:hypothetical protein